MNVIESTDGLVQQIRSAVAGELTRQARATEAAGGRRLAPDDERALARSLVNAELERLARDAITTGRPVLDDRTEQEIARSVFDRIFQLGRLQPLLEDERISNIIANGHDRVFVEYADELRGIEPAVDQATGILVPLEVFNE